MAVLEWLAVREALEEDRESKSDIIFGCIGIIYLDDSSASVHSERSVAVRYGRRERAHNSDATGFDMSQKFIKKAIKLIYQLLKML
ncbi:MULTISPECIES: hypothetical protein [unclassified Microcoleus]|uniref:hypothetical protein n=1 Tax=unclassified Microcoleus TaxID=2642155 RepID=UPI002FD1E69C